MKTLSQIVDLDKLLDSPISPESLLSELSSLPSLPSLPSVPEVIELIDLRGETDPRLKLLSHSSRTTLHKCPRKYQLYRLSSTQDSIQDIKQSEQDVTFAYGTAVGVGIQSALEGKTEDQIVIDTFLAWDTDLLAETKRHNKSFWLNLFAVMKFKDMLGKELLSGYEVVTYKGQPAVELSFQVILPNGFKYRGFIDAVLKNTQTGEIIVLECKTSSGTANSAMFKNSGQALGYSVVLDILFPEVSSYTVLYLVYETKSYKFVPLPFEKSLLQRALWLQELLIDCQVIELYESYDIYPMHGESCFDFFRECEYLSLCTMKTDNFAKPYTTKIRDGIEKASKEYQFSIEFNDLVEAQIKKGTL